MCVVGVGEGAGLGAGMGAGMGDMCDSGDVSHGRRASTTVTPPRQAR